MSGFHYQIRLEPDLEQFCFRGLATVSIEDDFSIIDGAIMLNAHELDVEYCTVNGMPAEFNLELSHQTLSIYLPYPTSGPVTIHISYTGKINDQYAGLYRSRYEHNGQEKWLASSQFQASDARRVFPCFDHPAKKGTFKLSLLLDRGLSAISNSEIVQIDPQEDGKNLIHFGCTPKMSPYLLFIGIGEFEFLEDKSKEIDLRVVTTAGKSKYGHFAINMAAGSLDYCERFTGIKYPLAKCDLIAVPDSIGAMENFGAIRHSENLLLVNPDSTSQADRMRIGSIIAHEISHMWFGNLVSLAEWKYLWLNEALATYFTYAIPAQTNPEWDSWSEFVVNGMQEGLERDALRDSSAIELPQGQPLEGDPAPTPSNAPIIYFKGAAVLRMLSQLVGQENFKKGLHHYLQSHQYDSVTSFQFWETFDQAAGRSNREFAAVWMYQPGFPLISVERKDNKLHLRQQRFTYLPSGFGENWIVPVEILLVRQNNQFEKRSIYLEQEKTTVAIPPDTIAYKLNHEQRGFYRVRYTESDLVALGPLVKTRQLSTVDSYGLQNDLFALLRRGDFVVNDYLAYLASFYLGEIRYFPLVDIGRNMLQLHLLLASRREQIAHVGRVLFEKALDAIGMEPQEEDDHQTLLLRNALLWAAHTFGSNSVTQLGYDAFCDLLAGERFPADTFSMVLKFGAAMHDQALDYLIERLTCGALSELEMGPYLEALGNFQGEAGLRQALDTSLEITPKNLQTRAILAAVHNPAAATFLWGWFVENWGVLRTLQPAQVERLLAVVVPICGLISEAEVISFCHDFVAENSRAEDSIKMALENLEINSRLLARENSLAEA